MQVTKQAKKLQQPSTEPAFTTAPVEPPKDHTPVRPSPISASTRYRPATRSKAAKPISSPSGNHLSATRTSCGACEKTCLSASRGPRPTTKEAPRDTSIIQPPAEPSRPAKPLACDCDETAFQKDQMRLRVSLSDRAESSISTFPTMVLRYSSTAFLHPPQS